MEQSTQIISSDVRIVSDIGSGKVTVLLRETACESLVSAQALQPLGRIVCVALPEVTGLNARSLAGTVIEQLENAGVRQAVFCGVAGAAAVVAEVAQERPRFVRQMVFINATTRPHPSRLMRFTDAVERFLPLGLPLRISSGQLDTKPFLQRLRCPALVVVDSAATDYERAEARVFAERLPTAWMTEIRDREEMVSLLQQFFEVPARCPQKNR